MAHDLVGHASGRRMAGETDCRVSQRLKPLWVDAIGIQVIALAEGLRDGRPQPASTSAGRS